MLCLGFLETKFKESSCLIEISSEKIFTIPPLLPAMIRLVILSRPHPGIIRLTLSMIVTSVYSILPLMPKPSYFKIFSGQVKPSFPSYSPSAQVTVDIKSLSRNPFKLT